MGRFDGRAVIVTGSSNGIGRATAQLFARKGAMVTICGRDENTLNESKNIVLAENGNAEEKVLVVRGDIREEEVMQRTIGETVKKFGRLDVLVNNAGGAAKVAKIDIEKSELEGDMAPFDYALDLNLKSVFRLCQLAYPHLMQTKGEIVNVSSIAGLNNGNATISSFYSIAKAAQDQLTRNLAIHYITKGMEDQVITDKSRIPYQKIGKPEEVAEAILFLADRKRSNYIVGHQLVIDSGASLQMPLIAESPKIFAQVMADMVAGK
ncbi:oxidoreductase, short chain dehydrogenase/reductase family protein [Necator americanus]|uniref:Oxidoreductase, short chain dehydrogenase/reductase family protein n=1 Tax=Necator americanus TaxID=51031 RepID=W2SMK4_NECAM|nr:oxidoreductase, short chain dehydrogenase/reductase family protein [Necator americanus]ETN70860.1 oxidoreductase, short chain dehydrogenase/reductase family protein [Necator americanus]